MFTLRNYSEGYKINKPLSSFLVYVLNISQLPSKLRFLANCSFFGQSFSLGHYPLIYQLLKGVYLLNKNPLNLSDRTSVKIENTCLEIFALALEIFKLKKYMNDRTPYGYTKLSSYSYSLFSSLPNLIVSIFWVILSLKNRATNST